MRYVEALSEYDRTDEVSLFLGGGISGCPSWQREMVALLADTDLTLLNPRRADFPIYDPNAANEQIEWEFRHLRKATALLFWFPCETLCPITLYELGAWSMTDKPIFVGTHLDYPRRRDIEIQTRMVRPEVPVAESLVELAGTVIFWRNRIRL
jgi:hypothetical protein